MAIDYLDLDMLLSLLDRSKAEDTTKQMKQGGFSKERTFIRGT